MIVTVYRDSFHNNSCKTNNNNLNDSYNNLYDNYNSAKISNIPKR